MKVFYKSIIHALLKYFLAITKIPIPLAISLNISLP